MPASLPTLLTVLLLVGLAACASPAVPSSAGGDPSPSTAPVVAAPSASRPATPPASPPSARPPGTADLDAVSLAIEAVVQLDAPTAFAVRPGDDALYIAERPGRVVRVVDGAADDTAVLDITEQTTNDGERGLLGLTFSPTGDVLYVSYTDRDGASRLDAYDMDGAAARPDSSRHLLRVPQPFSNHNGGGVATGPDGLLYLGLGDGGAANDPLGNGQDRTTLLGGILRIDPSVPDGEPYGVPEDNPFVGTDGRDELWIYGLRNPWRFSFDSSTGDLWIGDVGQNEIEEIDLLPYDAAAGANLGWNVFEGTRRFSQGSLSDAVPPVFEYPHDGRCSVTGGYVYRGQDIPALRGAYVFGDFCDGVVRALVAEDGETVDARAFDVRVPSLVSFGQDADGELYALSLEGTVYRMTGG